jgi:hypothetical protein
VFHKLSKTQTEHTVEMFAFKVDNTIFSLLSQNYNQLNGCKFDVNPKHTIAILFNKVVIMKKYLLALSR